ncbi:MAG: glycosyltransferase family 2 protein [Massilia sp.]|nr:glycosyltransferase family 2 protein [Massilia sp.]
MHEPDRSLSSGVAIVTFNGLKYLPPQLDSIINQSRPLVHIVISDDRSTDGTWEYLQQWAASAAVRVTLLRNEVQLGLSANVEQAIKAVEADIIFTSDQDDVWFADKVATIAAEFENDPEVQLVHSDAILVDKHGADLGTRLFGELELSSAELAAVRSGNAFQVYCRRNVVTGATAAFRSSLLKLALPLPPVFYHDAWLAFLASATGKVRLLDAPTIAYRQHGSNLVGVKKLKFSRKVRQLWWDLNKERGLTTILERMEARHASLHARLALYPEVRGACKEYLADALQFARERQGLPRNPLGRTARVLAHAVSGRYGKFSYEPKTDIFRDIIGK